MKDTSRVQIKAGECVWIERGRINTAGKAMQTWQRASCLVALGCLLLIVQKESVYLQCTCVSISICLAADSNTIHVDT